MYCNVICTGLPLGLFSTLVFFLTIPVGHLFNLTKPESYKFKDMKDIYDAR